MFWRIGGLGRRITAASMFHGDDLAAAFLTFPITGFTAAGAT